MAQKKKNKRRRRQFQQKVILSVLLVIIIGLIGVLGYQMQKNEKKQTDGNASASSSVSSSSLAGDSSEPISDSSQEEEITPTPEPVQQISSDGLNSQHALLVRESDLAEMMNLGGDERIYPASMTKIMTALLTIENLPDLNETITVPEDIFEELTAQDASVAGFNPYEQPTVRDLLYGVLLPSGADACETLARAVGCFLRLFDVFYRFIVDLRDIPFAVQGSQSGGGTFAQCEQGVAVAVCQGQFLFRTALVATLRIFAGEFQIRRAKRVISTVDIETAGL